MRADTILVLGASNRTERADGSSETASFTLHHRDERYEVLAAVVFVRVWREFCGGSFSGVQGRLCSVLLAGDVGWSAGCGSDIADEVGDEVFHSSEIPSDAV